MSRYHKASAMFTTACRHGSFLTEETCTICRAEAEAQAENAPNADAPEYVGMDAIDLEAEQVGRLMAPGRSVIRRRRRRDPRDRPTRN